MIERRGRLVVWTVSKPGQANVLDGESTAQARDLFADFPSDAGAVLLVGGGPNFCTGGDISTFGVGGPPGADVEAKANELHRMTRGLVALPVPVIAAVQGWAAGAGMSLACLADIVICGTSSRFRPGYPSIGLTGDGGITWTLPRAVGATQAREIMLTDAVVDAERALRIGLVARVVADADVLSEAQTLARTLADGPTGTYGRLKSLLGRDGDFDSHLDEEARQMGVGADSAEGREGVRAFVERRRPVFH